MSRDFTYLKESGETDHMIGNGKFVLWAGLVSTISKRKTNPNLA